MKKALLAMVMITLTILSIMNIAWCINSYRENDKTVNDLYYGKTVYIRDDDGNVIYTGKMAYNVEKEAWTIMTVED